MPLFLSKRDMSDLLVTAWEGGSGYWVESAEIIPPKGMSYKDLKRAAWEATPEEDRDLWRDEGPVGRWPLYSMISYLPPSVKWKIHFKTGEGGDEADLTPKNMREALSNLAKKHPGTPIIKRIMGENYDAGDADAWLQTALFGDVIFG
jgi:hypothetical protein